MARQKMRWTFTIVDRDGVKAPATLYGTFDDTLTVGAMLADLTAMRANIAAVTDGQILSCEATLVAAGAAAPANFANSDVSKVGNLDFRASSGRLWADVFPAYAESEIVAGHINLSGAGTAVLLTALETTPGDFEQTNREWLAATTFVDAFLSTRKHRRQLKRASFEANPA